MHKPFVILMLLLVAAPTLAERPPQFPKDATDIVTAKVLRIYTSTEPFAGDGVMTHYIADLEVAGASKGQLKEGDVISARWFHVTKSPSKPLPAAYGHAYGIKPGDSVEACLIGGKGSYNVIYSDKGIVKKAK
jgi:hypothetical protein